MPFTCLCFYESICILLEGFFSPSSWVGKVIYVPCAIPGRPNVLNLTQNWTSEVPALCNSFSRSHRSSSHHGHLPVLPPLSPFSSWLPAELSPLPSDPRQTSQVRSLRTWRWVLCSFEILCSLVAALGQFVWKWLESSASIHKKPQTQVHSSFNFRVVKFFEMFNVSYYLQCMLDQLKTGCPVLLPNWKFCLSWNYCIINKALYVSIMEKNPHISA